MSVCVHVEGRREGGREREFALLQRNIRQSKAKIGFTIKETGISLMRLEIMQVSENRRKIQLEHHNIEHYILKMPASHF